MSEVIINGNVYIMVIIYSIYLSIISFTGMSSSENAVVTRPGAVACACGKVTRVGNISISSIRFFLRWTVTFVSCLYAVRRILAVVHRIRPSINGCVSYHD